MRTGRGPMDRLGFSQVPTLRARIIRIAVSFGAVLSAYLVYALVAVRLIEPSVSAAPKTTRSPEDYRRPASWPTRPRCSCDRIFPKVLGSCKNPKIVGNDRVKLLFSDYSNRPGGILNLKKCTMLFFEEPNPNKPKAQPIILQPSEGAILQFDEEFDLTRAQDRPTCGRRDERCRHDSTSAVAPGADDDLLIVTREVKLIEDRVVTPEAVNFRFGKSYGSGRDMTILLERDDPPGKQGKAKRQRSTASNRSRSRARSSVHMIRPSGDGAEPPAARSPRASAANRFRTWRRPRPEPAAGQNHLPGSVPLRHRTISGHVQRKGRRLPAQCQRAERRDELRAVGGPFRGARRKPGDRRGRKTPAKRPPAAPHVARSALDRSPGRSGDHPRSLARQPDSRPTGRVRPEDRAASLSTGREAARSIAPEITPAVIPPSGRINCAVEPLVGEQLVTLLGGAKVSLTDMGSARPTVTAIGHAVGRRDPCLAHQPAPADRARPVSRRRGPAGPTNCAALHRQRSPPPGGPGRRPSSEGRLKRVLAQGAVRIESPQLIGATGQLDAIFVPAPPAGRAKPAPGSRRLPANRAAAGAAPLSQQQFRVARIEDGNPFGRSRRPDRGRPNCSLDGKAQLVEAENRQARRQTARGHRRAFGSGPGRHARHRIVVIGKPGHVEARGLTLAGPEIQLERAHEMLWIDGPGRMTGAAPRQSRADQPSAPAAAGQTGGPGNVEITWTGKMQFDGKTAHFERAVVARTATWLVRTETLDATLQRTIDFLGSADSRRQGRAGRVRTTRLQRRPAWSGRIGKPLDRRKRTVVDRSHGSPRPGIESHDRRHRRPRTGHGFPACGGATRPPCRAQRPASPPPKTKPVPTARPGPIRPQRVTYLAVQFARSISGNMYTRELTFANQVSASTVRSAAGKAKLDVENPDQAGPEAMALTCDALTVREAPGRAGRRPRLAGARDAGEHASRRNGYSGTGLSVDLLPAKVADGDGRGWRSDASVFRQEKLGGPRSNTTASRILYWPSTKRIEVDNGQFIDLGPSRGKPARRDAKSTTK